jgi:hypothetical protein
MQYLWKYMLCSQFRDRWLLHTLFPVTKAYLPSHGGTWNGEGIGGLVGVADSNF